MDLSLEFCVHYSITKVDINEELIGRDDPICCAARLVASACWTRITFVKSKLKV